jgi:glycosyltransferase involved in cell wall biosynthesis
MASMRAAPHSRPRIAVLKDGFVPEYRAELFARLGQMKEVEYVIFHGPAPRGTGHRAAEGPFSFPQMGFANRELRIGGRTLVYQPAVRAVAGPAFVGAVLGAELKMLAHVVLFPLLKLRGKPVLLWGQGGEKSEDRGSVMEALGRIGGALKTAAARHADGYIAYTAGGRDRLVEAGADPAKVFVVRNTLDVEAEIELHSRLSLEPVERLRSELGLRQDSAVLLFVGRVYPEKKLSELVLALGELRDRELTRRPVELVVVGDGPDLARVREEAAGVEGIHFAGEIREPERVGRYLRVASAMAIPGKVGLAVNHAFAHGVPVITRVSPLHAPEFEYLEPERNSIVADGGHDAFVAAIAEFVDSEEQRARLAAGALESREGLTVASMASSFHRAVCLTLGLDTA